MPLLSLLLGAALSAWAFPVPAMSVSLGRSGRAVARVTYDKRKAEGGGLILAAASLSKADLEALRMSEAAVTASGGLLSFASMAAREHEIPAVILGGASWKDGVLVLERPVFGAAKDVEGFRYQAVEKTEAVEVHEGDVIAVDAKAGRLEIFPPGEQEARLSLAQAMRAYDGLRDAQALVQWYEGASDKAQAGPWLIEELAGRVAQGTAPAEDLLRARQAVKVPMSETLNGVWTRSLRSFMSDMEETEKSLGSAGSAEAARHLRDHAEARWRALRGLRPALYSSAPDKAAAAAFARVESLAGKRLKALASAKAGLAEAAASAGALLPRRVEVSSAAYDRFIAESGLGTLLADLLQDSSLGLRRKSQRIRAAIRKEALSAGLSGEIRARLPEGWEEFLVSGTAGSVSSSRDHLENGVREAWALLWSPASLGARERQGRGLTPEETGLALQETVKGEVAGAMMTRDLASGSRSRVSISAVSGGPAADQYVVDPRGREVLPAILADREKGRVLDGTALERLALLASALEDHFGRGLELRFAFSGPRLYLLETRPLAEDAGMAIPRVSMKLEKPAAEALPVQALGQ